MPLEIGEWQTNCCPPIPIGMWVPGEKMVGSAVSRKVLVVGHVTVDGGDDLAKVVFADGVFGVVLGVGQCRKQQCRKDRDEGDDHQKFDECKSAPPQAEGLG